MKRLTLICVSIFLLTNLIYPQDIINETGKDGKFIVRDAEQQEFLIIKDSNVEIKGTLSIDSLAQGSADDKVVVWSETDKQFKALYNLIPKSTINANVMAADSWTESGGNIYRATGNVTIGNTNAPYPLYIYRSGANASVVVKRDGGAINYMNAAATHGTFGTVNNFPTRIAQNAQIKMFFDKDNSGIYFGSTGNVTSSTDDDIDMTIDTNGNVGIGTAAPVTNLHVNGNDGFLAQGTFGNGVTQILGGGARMHFYPKKAAFRVGGAFGDYWDDANVGDYSVAMGRHTRASGMASTAMGSSTKASGYGTTALGYATNAESYASFATGRYNIGGGNPAGWSGTDPLFEIGNGTGYLDRNNAVTVLKNGNVGVGIINPTYKFDVAGHANLNNGTTGTFLRANGDEAAWYNDDYFSWGYDGNYNYFADEVQIGFTGVAPTHQLEVTGSSTFRIAKFKNTNTGIYSDGFIIEIGPTNYPTTSNYFIEFKDGAGNNEGEIRGTGSGGVAYVTSSDARLKTNLEGAINGLDLVSQIKVRKYEFKEAPGIENIGLYAQELQKVYPQAAFGDPTGNLEKDPMGIDYGRLTPLLVKAIQELQARIEVLESR